MGPFLSVTSCRETAETCGKQFEKQDESGIKLLKIVPDGPGCIHEISHVLKAEEVVAAFGLPVRDYFHNEHVIEQRIPKECVQRYSWGLWHTHGAARTAKAMVEKMQ